MYAWSRAESRRRNLKVKQRNKEARHGSGAKREEGHTVKNQYQYSVRVKYNEVQKLEIYHDASATLR